MVTLLFATEEEEYSVTQLNTFNWIQFLLNLKYANTAVYDTNQNTLISLNCQQYT